jgi:hypothetical protein
MKNKILWTITAVAGLGAVLSACALDTQGTYIPHIICSVCLAWLLPFVLINREAFNG